MKAKIILQIIIIAIIGTAAVQAQENINRKVRKEIREAKREIRKAKKQVSKSMKDADFGAIYFDKGKLKKMDGDPLWIGEDVLVFNHDHLEDLDDVLEDLEDVYLDVDDVIVDIDDVLVDIDDITVDVEDVLEDLELELKEGTYLFKHSPKAHVKVHTPEFYYRTPDIDIRLPKVYKWETFESESSNLFEISKELDNVSISKDYYFDVNEGAESLQVDIDGTLSSGDLTVTLKKPGGEIYQDFQISPLADVDWSQKLDLEKAGEGLAGKWTLSLSGNSATGSYQIRIKCK